MGPISRVKKSYRDIPLRGALSAEGFSLPAVEIGSEGMK